MWQTSDLVARSTILAVTQNCTGDCKVSARYLGGTLMANSSHYDKEGNLIYQDPNRRTTEVWCRCGRRFVVDQKGDEIIVVQMTERPR